jgi:glycosyltransferase involved in cell wall biosynthesis
MNKICHLTTVHHRYDTRIFVKECRALADQGFEVFLIVADGKGDEEKDQVQIRDLGLPKNRIQRVLKFSNKMFQRALKEKADLYHFHDPELLRVGSALAKKGKKVIYDVHEDVPRQLLTKDYLPRLVKKPSSIIFETYEDKVAASLSGIITATPFIRDRFLQINKMSLEIQNFPMINEFEIRETNIETAKVNAVCYVGSISRVRGIHNIIRALEYVENVKLLLGGKFESEGLREECAQLKGWDKVVELGFLDRGQVISTMRSSVAGLVVLEPTVNYLDSIPVKMFEYMASGIPVIASDFPYWRELLQGIECAAFVNPDSPEDIARAILLFVENKQMAAEMGKKGQTAVMNVFRWENEKKKLLQFYAEILN